MKFDLPKNIYNYDLLKKLSTLVEQLHGTEEEEEIFYDMIHSGRLSGFSHTDAFKKFINELEKHIAGEQVNLIFLLNFIAVDRDRRHRYMEGYKTNQRRIQSEQKTKEWTCKRLIELEEYLKLVDLAWGDPDKPNDHETYSKSAAIDEVWEKHSTEIIKIIERHNKGKKIRHKQKVTKKTFASIFENYIEFCIKYNDRKTLNGRTIKQRKRHKS